MANTHITVNQYEELLKRIERVEHGHEEIEVPVDELKEKYHKIDKTTAVTDNKVDALRVETKQGIDSLRKEMHVEINSLRKEMHVEINSLRTEHRITFGVTLTVLIAIAIKIFASSI